MNDGPVTLILERGVRMIPPLVLASASPRRKQLLEMLGIPCIVVPSRVPEVRIAGEKAIPYAERLAQSKALSVEGDLVLAADTIVVSGQSILEKPADEADAFHMLVAPAGALAQGGHRGRALAPAAAPAQDRRHQGDVSPRLR